MIEGLCQRYHCLPSQIYEEDASYILKAVTLLKESGDEEQPDGK